MAAVTLDGAALARRIRAGLVAQVQTFTQRAGRPPGLALVLVGDDPASQVYVGSKRTQGSEVGFRVDLHERPGTTTLDELLALVRSLNDDDAIDGTDLSIAVSNPARRVAANSLSRLASLSDGCRNK